MVFPFVSLYTNEIRKLPQKIAIFDLVKYGVNGKTATSLPLGSNFDNF